MLGYEYDPTTGGILLIDKSSALSNEPRPVYAMELDVLGIDSIWKYKKQNDIPYMWAEAHRYFYRGTHVFSTTGGSLYQKPGIDIIMRKDKNEKPTNEQALPAGTELMPVDIAAMCRRNEANLNIIEQITLKKIYAIYKKYKDKLDCFHVAFSGGKDSIVLLELVKKALPHNSFMVVFGDTKMEFPDTYKIVDIVEQQCKEDGIAFYRAASHLSPDESWRLFGPPSRVLRWCCTVHKAAPQTLKIREVLGKDNYVGMDFVGVRAHESAARSSYEEENYGKKQKGQYSHNSILDWTSAEIWLYIYSHNLPVNEAYKKGNSRAGCLFCPMGGGKSDWFRNKSYPKEIKRYTDIIKETINTHNIETYITNAGWITRKNGRDLKNNTPNYYEEIQNGILNITIKNPRTDWQEWIKTLGTINYQYSVEQNGENILVSLPIQNISPSDIKHFKYIFHKAASCIKCKVCQANCKTGSISFDGKFKISNCVHCKNCHEIDNGCLMFHSLLLPKNGEKKMKSINSFADHAPKPEWVHNFFDKGNNFDWGALGPMQVQAFKRFLHDSGLTENNKTTVFFDISKKIGWNSSETWGMILVNLSYCNRQIQWYIDNMPIGSFFSREEIENMLISENLSKKNASSVVKAFKRLSEIPLGTSLKFGTVITKDNKFVSIFRNKANLQSPEVLLYSLYRYAEACDGYYQFTLSTLMDTQIQSAGISPVKIFGFERYELETMLRGLSAKYPDYIDVSFTHDLEKINLRDYHKSADILNLL